jgi:hypothetical protein
VPTAYAPKPARDLHLFVPVAKTNAMAVHVHFYSKSSGLSYVVRLGSSLHHNNACFLQCGLCNQEFQGSGLLAAGGHAGSIITFGPYFRPA